MIRRGEAVYEPRRRALVVAGRVPQRYPELIVRPRSPDEVAEAIMAARAEGLGVAVRSGGHSWCGASLRDGTLLLDLSAMAGVSVDARARTAALGPGLTSGGLTTALEAHGLGFPAGHSRDVGMGGYLLSGGLGWNGGVWGPACHSVVAIEAVTADGAILTADDSNHADLLWAARGAGPGFFAVVTRFHVRVYPSPRSIVTSSFAFPASEHEEVAGWLDEIAADLDKRLELSVAFGRAPSAIEELGITAGQAVLVVTAVAFADSRSAADALLAPLESGVGRRGLAEKEARRETPQQALYELAGARLPAARQVAADCLWSTHALREVAPALVNALSKAPSPNSWILATVSPPGEQQVDPLPSAFAAAGRLYASVYAVWVDAADEAPNRRWIADTMAALSPLTSGRYIGEADLFATPDGAERFFTPSAWRRLARVREHYDPEHLFAGYPTTSDLP